MDRQAIILDSPTRNPAVVRFTKSDLRRGAAVLLGIGRALPFHRATAAQSAAFSLSTFDASAPDADGDPRQAAAARTLINRVHARASIDARHTVIADFLQPDPALFTFFPPTACLSPAPGTARRMEIYEVEAPPLAEAAALAALRRAGVAATAISHLVVATCTGFFAPGIDIALARRLGLSAEVDRTIIGFMGCHAGLVGMRTAALIVAADPSAVVLQVCVELCSIHYRTDWSPDSIVCGALFADGAAAAVWAGVGREGTMADDPADIPEAPVRARYLAGLSRVSPGTLDHMTWRIGDAGFVMTLDAAVPEILRAEAPGFLDDLLERAGVARSDVAGWAIHPGGRRIVEVLADALQLSASDVASSMAVLRGHGNMSSPTILFVIDEELKRRDRPAGPVVCLAFGPGLTIEGAVIERFARDGAGESGEA